MLNRDLSTLVIGYGNPGRQDDGLGPAFVQQLESVSGNKLALQSNYQLSVEDAFDIQALERVIFVDACIEGKQAYTFTPLKPVELSVMGSHSLSPGAVLQLCRTLYGKAPTAFVLAIRGHEFDKFEERLSRSAQHNLDEALKFFHAWLQTDAVPVTAVQQESGLGYA